MRLTCVLPCDDLRLAGNHFAGVGLLSGSTQTVFNVQLARTAIVIKPVCGIGILLRFHDDCSAANGMHGARVNINHVTCLNIHPIQEMLHAGFTYGAFHFCFGGSRLETKANLCSGSSLQHVPTFGLAAGLTNSCRAFVVWMDLHRKLFFGKEELDQQRKAGGIASGIAQKLRAKLPGKLGERASGQRAIGYRAAIAGEPGFADRASRDLACIKSAQDRERPKCAHETVAATIKDRDPACEFMACVFDRIIKDLDVL